MLAIAVCWFWRVSSLLRAHRKAENAADVRANYGVRVMTTGWSTILTSEMAKKHNLNSKADLVKYAIASEDAASKGKEPVVIQADSNDGGCTKAGGGIVQSFVVAEQDQRLVPFKTLGDDQEFKFTAFMGFKLRIVRAVPLLPPPAAATAAAAAAADHTAAGLVPLAMRGVTVAELQEFHDHFNGATSRDMQEQMMREQAADGMEGMSYFEWWVLPRRRLREQEEQHGLLPPNAVVSYSW
jgi:hypothetical protein